MDDRLDLELDQFKRGLADLDARMHALEANAPPQIAADIGAATVIISDLQVRVHMLEAKVTRLQMFSLDRPNAFQAP